MKINNLRWKWLHPAVLIFLWNLITWIKLLYEKTQIPVAAIYQNLLVLTLQFCTVGPYSLIILYELDKAVTISVCTPAWQHLTPKQVEHFLHLWLFIKPNLRQIILSHIFIASVHLWMYFPFRHHWTLLDTSQIHWTKLKNFAVRPLPYKGRATQLCARDALFCTPDEQNISLEFN